MSIGAEECVGIAKYCSPHAKGFNGRIKDRPEDFQVQEVAENGDIIAHNKEECHGDLNAIPVSTKKETNAIKVQEPSEGWKCYLEATVGKDVAQSIADILTTDNAHVFLQAPAELQLKVQLLHAIQQCYPGIQSDACKDEAGSPQIKLSLDPVFDKLRQGGMVDEDCDRVMSFLLRGPKAETAENGITLLHATTKEERTKLHRLISSSSSCLVSKTVNDQVVVHFSPKTMQKQKRKQDTFLLCSLKKVDVDHFTAIDSIAKACRASPSDISVAGTKDKRAITFQQVVLRNILHVVVNKAKDQLEALGLHLRALKYVEKPLSLGQSLGNRFTIRIRDVDAGESIVKDALESTRKHGCINYFGFQRVGLPHVPTRSHHIGQAMMQENWENAVRLLFTQTQEFDNALEIKRAFLSSWDVSQTLKNLPDKCVNERAVLMGFRRHGPKEFKKAMVQIPYHRRVLFLHAYQSYFFNRMASFRYDLHGKEVVIGDLVQDPQTKEVRHVENPADEDIRNVVLPLIGTKVIYPNNQVGEYFIQSLKEDGIDLSLCSQESTVKGAYRHVFVHPKDLTWNTDGKDVCISFQLPPGSFATIFLRERARVRRPDESTYDRRPHLVISLKDQCIDYTPRTIAKHMHELEALRERVNALEGILAESTTDPVLNKPPANALPPLNLDSSMSPNQLKHNISLEKLPTKKDGFELSRNSSAPALFPVRTKDFHGTNSAEDDASKLSTESASSLAIFTTKSANDQDASVATKFIADQDGSLIVAVSKRSKLYTIIQTITNRIVFKDEQILRLKKMVDAEFGDVIAVLEEVEHETNVAVIEEKINHLLQTGSPSKFFMTGSPPKFKVVDIPYPLTKIAQSLSTLAINQEVVVLVSSGAYNPVHMLHIRAFYVARQHIEANYKFPVVGGIISPCHDTYVRTKNRRKPREMIPKAHRLAMLEAATASSSWIEVDKWEITRRRVLDYLSTLTHVREICEHQFPQFKFRVLYVCGVNTIVKLSHTALKEEGFGCIAICRPNQTEMLHKHLGAKWTKTAIVVEDVGVLPCELERATSFRVRQALIEGENCSSMVGKQIFEYMQRHHIGDKIAGREQWLASDRLWRDQDLPYVEYSESELQCRQDPMDC